MMKHTLTALAGLLILLIFAVTACSDHTKQPQSEEEDIVYDRSPIVQIDGVQYRLSLPEPEASVLEEPITGVL